MAYIRSQSQSVPWLPLRTVLMQRQAPASLGGFSLSGFTRFCARHRVTPGDIFARARARARRPAGRRVRTSCNILQCKWQPAVRASACECEWRRASHRLLFVLRRVARGGWGQTECARSERKWKLLKYEAWMGERVGVAWRWDIMRRCIFSAQIYYVLNVVAVAFTFNQYAMRTRRLNWIENDVWAVRLL